jgi:hypothetical protein
MSKRSDGPGDKDESDSGDESIHARYDWGSKTPSTAVTETVAIALDREVTAGDPLYEFIDPDSLDELFQSNHSSRSNDISVSFLISGLHVTVHSRGDVIVHPN